MKNVSISVLVFGSVVIGFAYIVGNAIEGFLR